jgi:P4 family phage/plasmid primase-like protien
VEVKAGRMAEKPDDGDYSLCEHAAAVWFTATTEVLYEPEEKSFYRYDPSTGSWIKLSDQGMQAAISNAMFALADDLAESVRDFLKGNKARGQHITGNIANFVQAEAEQLRVFDNGSPRRVVHARNGMVQLEASGPVLRPFGPQYYSRNQIPHDYVAGARCPRFLRELLLRGFGPDDAELVQRLAGLLLIGQNLAQKIVLLRGPAGRGKSRIVAVLQALVGEPNYSALRPDKLNDRFEIGGYIGTTALFGADLGPRVLASEAAENLKSLSGGDKVGAELKGGKFLKISGRFNIWGVTNHKGVIKIESDTDAWERRMVVLDYDAPAPEVKIPDFEDVIMAEEGSGVLAWAVEGAHRYLVEAAAGVSLRMHDAARQRVANLLDESRSVEIFIKEVVAPYAGGSGVTLDELYEGYIEWCGDRGWEPERHERFSVKSKALLLSVHRLSVSNSIEREGKARRGIRNCTLLSWQDAQPELGPTGTKILD